MTTFGSQGFLFDYIDLDVPLACCGNYATNVISGLTGETVLHGFQVDFFQATCPTCDTTSVAEVRGEPRCRSCDAALPLPRRDPAGFFLGYEELRRGYGAVRQFTEYGFLTPELAVQGRTSGITVPATEQVFVVGEEGAESVPPIEPLRYFPDPKLEWSEGDHPDHYFPSLDAVELLSLVRTPTISAAQGVEWLFDAGRPMTFMGVWDEERFVQEAEDGDGEALFGRLAEGFEFAWGSFGVNLEVFVFRGMSGRLRVSLDMT